VNKKVEVKGQKTMGGQIKKNLRSEKEVRPQGFRRGNFGTDWVLQNRDGALKKKKASVQLTKRDPDGALHYTG